MGDVSVTIPDDNMRAGTLNIMQLGKSIRLLLLRIYIRARICICIYMHKCSTDLCRTHAHGSKMYPLSLTA